MKESTMPRLSPLAETIHQPQSVPSLPLAPVEVAASASNPQIGNDRPISPNGLQNGNEMPIWQALNGYTDQQLIALINEKHPKMANLRRVLVRDARLIGIALNIQRQKVGHGNWYDWLAANTHLKPRTASNYLSIADNWDRIVQAGKDQGDVKLSDLLKFLAKPKQETAQRKTRKDADDLPKERPAFKLTEEKLAEFENLVGYVGEKVFYTQTPKETVFEALRFIKTQSSYVRENYHVRDYPHQLSACR